AANTAPPAAYATKASTPATPPCGSAATAPVSSPGPHTPPAPNSTTRQVSDETAPRPRHRRRTHPPTATNHLSHTHRPLPGDRPVAARTTPRLARRQHHRHRRTHHPHQPPPNRHRRPRPLDRDHHV